MKKIVHRSVIPIYAAAVLWLLCCLFLPMYRLWHYILYAVIAVAGYFVVRHFFPGTVEEVETPAPPPDSGDAEVDRMILEGRAQLRELAALGKETGNAALRAHVASLETLGDRIFQALEADTTRLGRTRKFLSYYLPTTVSLMRRYRTLEAQQLDGANITDAMRKIEEMMGKVETAFQKQLDNLYEAEAMDVTADIQVMQQIMDSEGLLDKDDDIFSTISKER